MGDVTHGCKELDNTEVFFFPVNWLQDERINDIPAYLTPLFLRRRGLGELKADFVAVFAGEAPCGSCRAP